VRLFVRMLCVISLSRYIMIRDKRLILSQQVWCWNCFYSFRQRHNEDLLLMSLCLSVCNRWAEFLLKLLDTFESGMKSDSDNNYYWRIYAMQRKLVCCVKIIRSAPLPFLQKGTRCRCELHKSLRVSTINVQLYNYVCACVDTHIHTDRKEIDSNIVDDRTNLM
jgi:hypothetical protein